MVKAFKYEVWRQWQSLTSLFEKVIIGVIWARIKVRLCRGGVVVEKNISAKKQKEKKSTWISPPYIHWGGETYSKAEAGKRKKKIVCINNFR
jgi:hypothetical protein